MPTKPITNCMVDLETGGTRPGSVIFSIGAVFFDADGLYSDFYKVVSTESCRSFGLVFDLDTQEWWAKQKPEAREVLDQAARPEAPSLPKALQEFSKFLHSAHANKTTVKLWGNGASFDNPMLVMAYKAANIPLPWDFWNDRCFRTLKTLANPAAYRHVTREGVYHNALDDAMYQARIASAIFKGAGF